MNPQIFNHIFNQILSKLTKKLILIYTEYGLFKIRRGGTNRGPDKRISKLLRAILQFIQGQTSTRGN